MTQRYIIIASKDDSQLLTNLHTCYKIYIIDKSYKVNEINKIDKFFHIYNKN